MRDVRPLPLGRVSLRLHVTVQTKESHSIFSKRGLSFCNLLRSVRKSSPTGWLRICGTFMEYSSQGGISILFNSVFLVCYSRSARRKYSPPPHVLFFFPLPPSRITYLKYRRSCNATAFQTVSTFSRGASAGLAKYFTLSCGSLVPRLLLLLYKASILLRVSTTPSPVYWDPITSTISQCHPRHMDCLSIPYSISSL